MMLKSLILMCLIPSVACASLDVFDVATGQTSELSLWAGTQPHEAIFVLGEEHYQADIHRAQSDVIEAIVIAQQSESAFAVSWEFLNFPDQQNLDHAFTLYRNRRVSEDSLLVALFGANNAQMHLPYAPLFKVARKLGGNFLATNAPREWKSVITKEGLDSLRTQFPERMPIDYQNCSANYFSRFEEAMGGHAPGDALQRYFDAQCYTDNTMAQSLATQLSSGPNFLVVGSFHSDYRDGVVRELTRRAAERQVVAIKFVRTGELTPDEIEELKTPHAEYGPIADALVFLP
jgi:uncharacterized iron-regulated protein